MKEIYDKISEALTIDELDDFIKEIWLHEWHKTEAVVEELVTRLRDRVVLGEYESGEPAVKSSLLNKVIDYMKSPGRDTFEIPELGLRFTIMKSRQPKSDNV